MNTQPTPETDALWEAWADEKFPNGQFRYRPKDLADHARRLERERDEAQGQRDRLAGALHLIANETSCRECGGEDQARLAREALQSIICDALQSLTPNETLSNQ